MKWQVEWHVWDTGEVYTGLRWRRPDGKRPLVRPRRRCKDNMKMGIQEVGWVGMDWIAVAKDRDRCWVVVRAAMNFRVP
jgi:hypothetical protein